MYRFLKYLMGKFIKPTKLTCELEELQKIEYLDSTSQLNGRFIFKLAFPNYK